MKDCCDGKSVVELVVEEKSPVELVVSCSSVDVVDESAVGADGALPVGEVPGSKVGIRKTPGAEQQ